MVGEEQLEVEDEVEETHATPKKIFQILNQVKKLIRNCAFIEKRNSALDPWFCSFGLESFYVVGIRLPFPKGLVFVSPCL